MSLRRALKDLRGALRMLGGVLERDKWWGRVPRVQGGVLKVRTLRVLRRV